ncbi:MAG: hypothetical protein ACXV3D_05795 [Halobacteriota archaeon]
MVHEVQCDECTIEALHEGFDCRYMSPKKRFVGGGALSRVRELQQEASRVRPKPKRVRGLFRKRMRLLVDRVKELSLGSPQLFP